MDKDAKAGKQPDAAACDIYQQSLRQIDRYQIWVAIFDCIKNGLSTGSILVLMALGLAITFGTMGVINMAHGELMMVGAFTTYSMELLFKERDLQGLLPGSLLQLVLRGLAARVVPRRGFVRILD